MKTKLKYLVIEPYVYYNINETEALFYNTISGSYYKLNDYEVLKKLKKIGLNNSSLVSNISTENVNDDKFNNFVLNIKDLFIGDIIEASETPFSFYQTPILRNITENNMEGDINRNITESLFELTIFCNSLKNDSNRFFDAHKQFNFPRVNKEKQQIDENLIVKLISEIDNYYHRNINLIIGDLKDLNLDFPIFKMNYAILNCFLYFKTILKDPLNLLKSFETINIFISSDITEDEINSLLEKMSVFKQSEIIFQLIIESFEDYEKLEEIRINYNLRSNYNPYFHDNEFFFKENIFLTEEDVLLRKLSLNEIHQRVLINPSNYGKLYITENSNIYSNLNSSQSGNLTTQNIKEMVHKELSNNDSFWKKTRKDIDPCRNCTLMGLCPPISNYEYVIGKFNLCHVKKN